MCTELALSNDFDVNFLHRFLSSCPNVTVDVCLVLSGTASLLPIVASRVRKLTLLTTKDTCLDGLQSAAALRDSVESLAIDDMSRFGRC